MTYLIVTTLLFAVALPAGLTCSYLLVLTLLSARASSPVASSRQLCFDVIVPAHNEEAGIQRTVSSLLRMSWPADRFRVTVVADNCTDDTATVARNAGANVLERQSTVDRGKGYALDFAFRWSAENGWAQAVAVIDADAEVSTNLLEAFASRIEAGAAAVQAHYGVLNPWASWRTQVMAIAKGAFHTVRSRARERLRLSCGIRGNGWCVTHHLLRSVPYQSFSLTEDLEYGIKLGMAGHRVVYADEAHSNADMASGEANARQQRQRWEQGRFSMVRTFTFPLLRAAFRQRSCVCMDLALDLLVLPLSYVALNVVLLIILSTLVGWWYPHAWVYTGLDILCAAALGLYIFRGWQLSGLGWRGLGALAHVPGYLLWRISVSVGRKATSWIKTERERT